MTYCIAVSLDQGLVLTSDSRTNAGIDQVSTYSKMHLCETHADRSLVILSAGNLATTQGVILQTQRDIREDRKANLNRFAYLADAAEYVGGILHSRISRYTEDQQSGFSPQASLILAGQIGNEPHGTYLIYPEGNYITTSADTPYLQIGESKYGKPVLDRFITHETTLIDAATCSLISMDSTMKSNASVGPPIEVLIYPADSKSLSQLYRFESDAPYLLQIRQEWGTQLSNAFQAMPRFPSR